MASTVSGYLKPLSIQRYTAAVVFMSDVDVSSLWSWRALRSKNSFLRTIELGTHSNTWNTKTPTLQAVPTSCRAQRGVTCGLPPFLPHMEVTKLAKKWRFEVIIIKWGYLLWGGPELYMYPKTIITYWFILIWQPRALKNTLLVTNDNARYTGWVLEI